MCPEGAEVVGVSWIPEEEEGKVGGDVKVAWVGVAAVQIGSWVCRQDIWKEDLDSGP